jgi:predicted Na+-dependent transporter
VVNQLLILTMVWIGLSRSRPTIVSSLHLLGGTVLLAFGFHAVLLATTFLMSRLFRFGPGRREAVIFMGGQKTLPLSVLIQTTLFPQYGQALVFCVVHHMVHLFMDGYLVGKLAPGKANTGSATTGRSQK